MTYQTQTYEWLTPLTEDTRHQVVSQIADISRTCYKSKGDGAERDVKLVKHIVKSGHHAMLEHVTVSCRIWTDRAIANELERHRMASFAQESTRYCRYMGGINTVMPMGLTHEQEAIVLRAYDAADQAYAELLETGATAEKSRSVLPLGLLTELVITANLREWLHIIDLRSHGTTGKPHPMIQDLVGRMEQDLVKWLPEVFGNAN